MSLTGADLELIIADAKACVGKGWGGIIEDLVPKLAALGWDGDLRQCKEKFGGLRFYIGSGSQEVRDAIDDAEQLSCRTCEWCGKLGKLDQQGWWLTLCDECSEKRQAK